MNVYDSDGIEINIRDTVYFNNSETRYYVKDINEEGYLILYPYNSIIGHICDVDSSKVTHKHPDTFPDNLDDWLELVKNLSFGTDITPYNLRVLEQGYRILNNKLDDPIHYSL